MDVLVDELPKTDPADAGKLSLGHLSRGQPFSQGHVTAVTERVTTCQLDSDRQNVTSSVTVTGMDTKKMKPSQRLKAAMEAAGIGQAHLGKLMGLERQTVFKLMHDQQKITPEHAEQIAKHLPITAVDLLGLEGVSRGADHLTFNQRQRHEAPVELFRVSDEGEVDINDLELLELDVRARGGHGGEQPSLISGEEGHPVLARWRMPKDYLRANSADPTAVRIIRVSGDSMEPDYPANDRVLVDTSHRHPSPAGIYVLWDGYGLILKRLELVYGSSPPRVRLSSTNPAYPPIEMAVDDILINGRVVGKWTWK